LSVSRGAILDPDLSIARTSSYFLEVSAYDGGIGDTKLSGKTHVNISIVDVNNKAPVFEAGSLEPVTIAENVERGHFVTRILATDPDLVMDPENRPEIIKTTTALIPNSNWLGFVGVSKQEYFPSFATVE
jgi:hypothetical protein